LARVYPLHGGGVIDNFYGWRHSLAAAAKGDISTWPALRYRRRHFLSDVYPVISAAALRALYRLGS